MHEFLVGQMDYILFIYGLVFIFLSVSAHVLSRMRPTQLFWQWIALFGALQGIAEWTDMLALSVGDSVIFEVIRAGFLAVSFLCLVEIARAEAERCCGRIFASWIYMPLIVGVLVWGWMLDGVDGVNILSRYIFGVIGGLLAVRVLGTSSVQGVKGSSRSRALFLGLLGCYAITQLLVPKGAFFPASVVNQDVFFSFLGVPVQLVRMVLVGVLAGFIWREYAQDRFRSFSGVEGHDRLKGQWLFPAGLSVILLAGLVGTVSFSQLKEAEERESLLNHVKVAAALIDPVRIKAITGTEADLNNEDYRFIQQQFLNILKEQPTALYVYLFGQKDGKNVFLVDVQPPVDDFSSEPAAAPGEVYEESAELLNRLFSSGGALTVGPEKDKWGTFISGLVAINDPASGRVIGVLGFDYNSDQWARNINRYRLIPILITLLFALLFIVFFVFFNREREISQDAVGRELRQMELLSLLEDEQRHLQAIFDAMQAGLLLVDSNLRVKRLNQAVLAMGGQDFLSLADHQLEDTLSRTLRKEAPAQWEEASGNGDVSMRAMARSVLDTGEAFRGREFSHKTWSNGKQKLLWLEANASLFEVRGERHVLFSLLDITERKRVEEGEKKHLWELEVFYKASVSREERIIELKKEIERLTKQA